jgi:hypothetical protein
MGAIHFDQPSDGTVSSNHRNIGSGNALQLYSFSTPTLLVFNENTAVGPNSRAIEVHPRQLTGDGVYGEGKNGVHGKGGDSGVWGDKP